MYTFEKALLFAIPAFGMLMLVEYLYGLWRKRNTYSNISDGISSILSGLTFIVSNTIGFGVLVFSYDWIQSHVAIGEVDTSHWWVWLATFVYIDFIGYWMHRWSHENSFLWSMHVIHHSGEGFNLPVALRQPAFKWLGYRPIMLLPVAIIGVPAEVIAILSAVHIFAAFWYHTQHIGKLGWLEYIIVTPSQHRVHHAINDIYIDKNYANTFCWDRLFGTFQEELDHEPPVYGCLGPVRTWDPIKIEVRYMAKMLRDAIFTQKWSDKIRVFASHTGWRPADVAARWPGPFIDDYKNWQRFQPSVPKWLEFWGLGELLFITLSALYLFANIEVIAVDDSLLFSFVAIVLFSIISLAALLENKVGWLGAVGNLVVISYVITTSGSLYGLDPLLVALVISYLGLGLVVRAQRQWLAKPAHSPVSDPSFN